LSTGLSFKDYPEEVYPEKIGLFLIFVDICEHLFTIIRLSFSTRDKGSEEDV
jgi:hypothetical protein